MFSVGRPIWDTGGNSEMGKIWTSSLEQGWQTFL